MISWLVSFMSLCVAQFIVHFFVKSSLFYTNPHLVFFSQIGNDLQYFLISALASDSVFVSLISFGAWFHTWPVSLTKLFWVVLYLPPSSISLIVLALSVLLLSVCLLFSLLSLTGYRNMSVTYKEYILYLVEYTYNITILLHG